MQVEIITRIIFKLPEEADAAKMMQDSIRSKPSPDVYTRIIRTDYTVEIFMSRIQAGPIDRQTPKNCITCKYTACHPWDYPCRVCVKYSDWRPK